MSTEPGELHLDKARFVPGPFPFTNDPVLPVLENAFSDIAKVVQDGVNDASVLADALLPSGLQNAARDLLKKAQKKIDKSRGELSTVKRAKLLLQASKKSAAALQQVQKALKKDPRHPCEIAGTPPGLFEFTVDRDPSVSRTNQDVDAFRFDGALTLSGFSDNPFREPDSFNRLKILFQLHDVQTVALPHDYAIDGPAGGVPGASVAWLSEGGGFSNREFASGTVTLESYDFATRRASGNFDFVVADRFGDAHDVIGTFDFDCFRDAGVDE